MSVSKVFEFIRKGLIFSLKTVKKIDIHVHTSRAKGMLRPDGQTYASPAELREMYDKIGIEKGVLLPSINIECAYDNSTNRDMYEIVQAHPESFAWFCNIDPRQGGNSSDTDFSGFLEYYKSMGAKGVGEICANLYFDDPKVLNLFKYCEQYDMPVTFHMGNMGNDYGLVDEIGMPRLEKVLQMFPNLKIFGHSQKFWAEISGDLTEAQRSGYPTGKVVPGGRLVELMRKYPNLNGDMSAGSGFNAFSRDPEFGYAFIEEFQDRLYYGTDICAPENISDSRVKLASFLDEGMLAGKISYDAYYKVSRGNAERVLSK